jgi:hypothetical protein
MFHPATAPAIQAQAALIASGSGARRLDRGPEDRVRAQRYLERIFSDKDRMRRWLDEPNDAFDGRAPQVLLGSSQVREREKVLDYLSLWALWR